MYVIAENKFLQQLLAASVLIGGRLTFELDSKLKEELVNIGIATLKQQDNKQAIVIDEPLSIEAITGVLLLHPPLAETTQDLMKICTKYGYRSVEGFGLERLVFRALHRLAAEDKGLTVGKFAKKFMPKTQMPPWTITRFKVNDFVPLERLNVKNEAEYAKLSLIREPRLEGMIVYNTSTLMGPDAFYLHLENTAQYWSMACTTKLHTPRITEEEFKSAVVSTDHSKYFYTPDGEKVHPRAVDTHKEWIKSLKHPYYWHLGSLRLHILLPEIADKVILYLLKFIANIGICE
jgi:hypothetical protein